MYINRVWIQNKNKYCKTKHLFETLKHIDNIIKARKNYNPTEKNSQSKDQIQKYTLHYKNIFTYIGLKIAFKRLLDRLSSPDGVIKRTYKKISSKNSL